MLLLFALPIGLLVGLTNARRQRRAYRIPDFRLVWLVLLAFAPQFVAFYLPITRSRLPDSLAVASLLTSQSLLLIFAWANRKMAGMWVLICGLLLNLAVITANGGLMPISPQTAAHLVPADILQSLPLGERFGTGKDVLLLAEHTHLVCLSDIFLLPAWIHYQVAFSLGDIFIACGVFWLLAREGIAWNTFRRLTQCFPLRQ